MKKTVHTNGYILCNIPEHPSADKKGRIYEHRLVMENLLGRLLSHKEQVHHIDGVKTNNVPENLLIVSSLEHQRLENGWEFKNDIWFKPCRLCNKKLEVDKWFYVNRNNKKGHYQSYCIPCFKEKRRKPFDQYSRKEKGPRGKQRTPIRFGKNIL